MRKIKSQILSQLFMETSFAPRKQQINQIIAAEELYRIVQPERDYTLEFVCFRITGYRPKALGKEQIVPGSELIESLPCFILWLSSRIGLRTDEFAEKIYTIGQLAEKFHVSPRTIERWRKRGLLARKYIFPEGAARTGFSEQAVRQFINVNETLINNASGFTNLSQAEKKQLIEDIITTARDKNLSRQQAITKIARKNNRAVETVRTLLINFEKSNPQRKIFSSPRIVIGPKERALIFNMFEAGTTVDELAEKFCRSKSTIYRILSRRRIRKLHARKIEYIHSPEFLEPGAEGKILGQSLSLPGILKGRRLKLDSKEALVLPKYFDLIKKAPTLNRQQEMELFRRYNFLKYLADEAKTRLNMARPCAREVRRTEQLLHEAQDVQNVLIQANLKLVVRVAARHRPVANLSDLVGEGNISLMRAVEGFDYSRGFRFSTYASWVIAKDFARHVPAEASRPDRAAGEDMSQLESKAELDSVDIEAVESAHRSLEEVITDNLTPREQYIVRYHFGLIGTSVKKKSKTLKQLGDELGLTKERVRQIELVAIKKLRRTLSPEQFELLTR